MFDKHQGESLGASFVGDIGRSHGWPGYLLCILDWPQTHRDLPAEYWDLKHKAPYPAPGHLPTVLWTQVFVQRETVK